ncbi:MAG: glycosyltransferase [Hyphomicrobiales bacterium]
MKIAVILNCYPQTTETFIAQELLGLEQSGVTLDIFSLELPKGVTPNTLNASIRACVHYVPHPGNDPITSAREALRARKLPGYRAARSLLAEDMRAHPDVRHLLRFAQACAVANHLGSPDLLFAHFINRPAGVARYVSVLKGVPWVCSAHAKDIWMQADHDLEARLASARWVVTCSGHGYERLKSLSPRPETVHLQHHGLDLDRFAPFEGEREARTGSSEADPIRLLTVARAVPKKGLDTLIDALALLPRDLHWTWTHAGGGNTAPFRTQAEALGIAARMRFLGARPQEAIMDLYRDSDLFVLPCRTARDGDRDGVPNVLAEAASQRLPIVSSREPGVMELLDDGESALLAPADDARALAEAISSLARDPARRARLAAAAEQRVRRDYDYRESIRFLKARFEAQVQARAKDR